MFEFGGKFDLSLRVLLLAFALAFAFTLLLVDGPLLVEDLLGLAVADEQHHGGENL